VLRRIPDRNVWVIYAAILLLGTAYGVSIAVLAIHLDAHEIPKLAMGGLAAAFAVGIAAFALPAGRLVQRFGPKAVLLTALLGYATCVASFPYLTTMTALMAARFFDGAFSASIWVSAETALLMRADKTNKAFVMSLYGISLAIGYVVGPLVSSVIVRLASTDLSFVAAGALACASALVVHRKLDGRARQGEASAPEEHEATSGPPPAQSALELFWRIKTSCFGTFSYGYFQASVVLFLPLYLIESKSVPEERTILVTAFFAAGMLVMSAWVSRLGDRHGHLLIMRALAALGAAMVASFVLLSSFWMMCGAVLVAGATLASISPVSLALQGVVTARRDLGRANALYNASYAVGMLLGPPISSVLFTHAGGAAMLFHLAAMWTVFVAFTVAFAADDPARQRHGARALAR
jgi:MFS family permease